MKAIELNFLGIKYPSPRPGNPNGRPGKSQQEIPDEDDDDDALFEESELPETFDDDEDMEDFDVAGKFSGTSLKDIKDVYEYMNCAV